VALQNEMLILLGEKESRSEKALITATAKRIGRRVRECRVLEPVISTHDRCVFNDFSKTCRSSALSKISRTLTYFGEERVDVGFEDQWIDNSGMADRDPTLTVDAFLSNGVDQQEAKTSRAMRAERLRRLPRLPITGEPTLSKES